MPDFRQELAFVRIALIDVVIKSRTGVSNQRFLQRQLWLRVNPQLDNCTSRE
jgi:hypothetical protein